MAVLDYDWIRDLTEIQKNYVYTHYRQLWEYYNTYGYEMTRITFDRSIADIYKEVKSVKLVERLELPIDTVNAVREISIVQQATGNLRQVVVAVPNYHVAFISTNVELCKVLQKSMNYIPVVRRDMLTDDVLKCNCNAVILDDVGEKFTSSSCVMLEKHIVPFIRRTTLQWFTDEITVDVENLLFEFVNRYRPCKFIR